MKSKRKPIILDKIAGEPTSELRNMVAELCTGKLTLPGVESGTPWARRFAASGKGQCAFAAVLPEARE